MVCLNPLSRYEQTEVLADHFAATTKFDTGPVRNTVVTGAEISRETVSIDTYYPANSEATGINTFAQGAVGPVSVLDPPNYLSLRHHPAPNRKSEQDRGRHPEPLCARNRQLP